MADQLLTPEPPSEVAWSPGDIAVEENPGLLSRAIRFWTLGPSHVAVVARLDPAVFCTREEAVRKWAPLMPVLYEGRCVLWEADCEPDEPCLFYRRKIRGVQCHPLESLDSVPRLWRFPVAKPLTPSESIALTRECLRRTGQAYDYFGALLAGTHWLKRWLWWRAADRSSEFCDEFVGSVSEGAIGRRLGFPVGTNWGQCRPRDCVRLLRKSGVYGDLERIR